MKKMYKSLVCFTACILILCSTVVTAKDIKITPSESSKVEKPTERITTTKNTIPDKITSTTHNTTKTPTIVTTKKTTTKTNTSVDKTNNQIYSSKTFRVKGVIYWNGWKWTWYSQKVLPGRGLKIPGRYVDKNGYVCDENNYICLSSSSLKKGTIIKTPFGKSGKVYDTGCAYDVVDVYVNW